MKRIIYTAVALIICASVFGIADYLNAKEKGALVNYSDDVQTTEAVIPAKETKLTPPAPEEKLATTTTKELKKESKRQKKIARTKVKEAHYTAVIPNVVVTEKTKEPVAETIDPLNVLLQSKTTDDSIIQADTKRKISMEMFSRAPIREKKIKKK